jgi:hypothetical protein
MVKKKSEFIKLMEKGEVDDSYNKRGYFIPSLSRSRLGKKGNNKPIKAGASAQREFVDMITKMFNTKDMKIEVEPNVDTINNIINKKDKKKLN